MKTQLITQIKVKDSISKLSSRAIQAQTVTINTVNPKVYTYAQGSNGLNTDTAVYCLLDNEVRKEVFSSLRDIEFIEQVLTTVSGSRSGKISTDIALISFDLLQSKLSKVLASYGVSSSQRTLTVLDGFFVEIFARLKIITSASSIETFVYEDKFFLDKPAALDEMKKSRLKYTLDLFDISKIEAKREVGIAAIASEIASQAYNMETSLIAMKGSESELDTVISLIQMYVTNDHSKISENETVIFEDERFIALAHNLSFVKMALNNITIRPKASYNFWQRAIDRVDSAIKSSTIYSTVEIKAIKEYFTTSIVSDKDGLKQGIVVSRNLKESAPLQVFHKMNDTLSLRDEMSRLIEDQTTQRYLESAYGAASTLTMTSIHDFAVSLHTHIVKPEDELFATIFGASYDDLTYLAASCGAKLEVITDESQSLVDMRKIIFRLNTDNSQIRQHIVNFVGTVKSHDPLFSIIVMGGDYEGKMVTTSSDKLIEDPKNKMFTKVREFMDNRFEKPVNLKLNAGTKKIKLTVKLEDLLSSVPLDSTFSITPIQGSIIYETFFQFFKEINIYEEAIRPGGSKTIDSTFNENASVAFVSLLQPILASTDVLDMAYSAKGMIASLLEKQNHSAAEGRSHLNDRRVETELNINMGLLFLNKLGFVKTQARINEAISIFSKAKVFSQMGLHR